MLERCLACQYENAYFLRSCESCDHPRDVAHLYKRLMLMQRDVKKTHKRLFKLVSVTSCITIACFLWIPGTGALRYFSTYFTSQQCPTTGIAVAQDTRKPMCTNYTKD